MHYLTTPDGCNIFYRTYGVDPSKPVVVFLNGTTQTTSALTGATVADSTEYLLRIQVDVGAGEVTFSVGETPDYTTTMTANLPAAGSKFGWFISCFNNVGGVDDDEIRHDPRHTDAFDMVVRYARLSPGPLPAQYLNIVAVLQDALPYLIESPANSREDKAMDKRHEPLGSQVNGVLIVSPENHSPRGLLGKHYVGNLDLCLDDLFLFNHDGLFDDLFDLFFDDNRLGLARSGNCSGCR